MFKGTAGNDASVQKKLRELEDIVSKEKRQISELEHKYSLTLHQLDLATSREEQLRNEARELERNLALLKHELKEVKDVYLPFVVIVRKINHLN